MDRGDRGNLKGFYSLDFSGKKVKEEFIENNFSPKYLKFELFDILQMEKDKIIKLFKNNFVDLSIESSFSSRFPITQFIDIIKDAAYRRLEFFSYLKEENSSKSQVELNSNYEYNIFTTLNEQIASLNLPDYKQTQIINKFKEIYDSLKNTKSYE